MYYDDHKVIFYTKNIGFMYHPVWNPAKWSYFIKN